MKRKVTFRIQRFDPAKDEAPRFQEFPMEVDDMDRVFDVLNEIKWSLDGSLAWRRSCGHGVCGSDAMKINGRNRLACQVLIRDLKSDVITVEPLPSYPVVKDLVVEQTGFFEKLKAIKPYLITDEPPPLQERVQSEADREILEEAAKCILCGACTSSCPSSWTEPSYLGPAAFLKAYRYIFDTRDSAAAERLDVLNESNSLWRCHTIFNCVEACPKEINITWHISQLKKKSTARDL
jgi:succinate dehydrogenase / fumarate reductase iron-sulfur subunit